MAEQGQPGRVAVPSRDGRVVRVLRQLVDVPSAAWDALHDGSNPFVSHAFLSGMETCGCLRPDWGWSPRHVTLWDGGQLVAAAPGYLKGNSHGEFVFDHAWAQAFQRYGQDYYPKWLGAVPYSPVTGPRLLARDATLQRQLLDAIVAYTGKLGLSSAHVNFHLDGELAVFDAASVLPDAGDSGDSGDVGDVDAINPGWLARIDMQYQWHNVDGWPDFGTFLAAMDHKHRKNIRQERARVARAGIEFRVLHGDEASEADLAAMFALYLQTFAEYGNSPALTLEFIQHLARTMPRQLVIFLAMRDGMPVAGALCLRGADTLYGRYWGAFETVPGLHFETCYYQGIDYCLANGLARFEPGAQGEHKIARGFLPTTVHSRHWIADPAFAQALQRWCLEDAASVRSYEGALRGHSPFKPAGTCNDAAGHA